MMIHVHRAPHTSIRSMTAYGTASMAHTAICSTKTSRLLLFCLDYPVADSLLFKLHSYISEGNTLK